MLPQELIRTKRNGGTLRAEDISAFVRGVTDNTVTEGQVAAFCMAVLWRGLSRAERVALTQAMAHSGTMLTWSLNGPVLDKHSTGGVGDKTSLILGPLVAACGGYVPMLSGRGLGHTGGTLDKFDAIPGYQTQPDLATFKRVVAEVGCAIIGQTADLAPADKRIYAIRDTTGTVESIDLITASILSKKLAAGLDALVMDVKFGSGAFMQADTDAKALAESIASVANEAGVKTTALLTDMNETLGRTAGHSTEMREAIDWLKGGVPEPRLAEVTLALAAELLVLGGLAADDAEARAKCAAALQSGKAAEHFARMVGALGGPADLLDRPAHYLPLAPVERVVSCAAGFVQQVDARALGVGLIALGGGRARPSDAVDHGVGLAEVAAIGEAVGPQRPLARIYARTEAAADAMEACLRTAVRVGAEQPALGPLVLCRI